MSGRADSLKLPRAVSFKIEASATTQEGPVASAVRSDSLGTQSSKEAPPAGTAPNKKPPALKISTSLKSEPDPFGMMPETPRTPTMERKKNGDESDEEDEDDSSPLHV